MIEDQIEIILKELQKDISDALEKASKDVAKEGVDRLKRTSPVRTGKYAKGWGTTTSKDKIIIHNKKRPGLAHLLENGHASRNGGRVAAQKHIESVDDWIKQELERRIEKELK